MYERFKTSTTIFISPTQTMRQNMTIDWRGQARSDVLSHDCVSVQNNNGGCGRWSSLV